MGFNIRTALSDTTLPTGGGLTGKENIGVAKGTHIGTYMTGGRDFEDHFSNVDYAQCSHTLALTDGMT